LEKRFESYDWLTAIGSMLFFVAATLPWWERAFLGAELRKTGFGDWLGIIAAIAILGVGLLTVIVETESLPIPRWVLNPTWMLALSTIGTVCVGVRFFVDPFGAGGAGIRDTRGLGLYLAGAGAVLVLIGCVLAFQHRAEWAEAVARDEEEDDDDDEGDDIDEFGYDADEQDELIRRINESMERQSDGRRRRPTPEELTRPTVPHPTVQQQRKAERAERTAQAPTRRRRPTGPPIP
jgi:hypothetical protein